MERSVDVTNFIDDWWHPAFADWSFPIFCFLLKNHKCNTKTPSFSWIIHEKHEKSVDRSVVAPKFVPITLSEHSQTSKIPLKCSLRPAFQCFLDEMKVHPHPFLISSWEHQNQLPKFPLSEMKWKCTPTPFTSWEHQNQLLKSLLSEMKWKCTPTPFSSWEHQN